MRWIVIVTVLSLSPLAWAQDVSLDAGPGPVLKEGQVLSFKDIEKLKPYLPEAFWENREYFFFDGMSLEIGPSNREYGVASAYSEATQTHRGEPGIGPDGALENYTAGQPFPTEGIDCKGDPAAGIKLIWNFMKQWEGDGARANWSFTYWDRGEQLPLFYKGRGKMVQLTHRVESKYRDQAGDLFKKERRQNALGVEVIEPFDARGISVLSYRYKAADRSLPESRYDDTWVYAPDLRRTRRITTAQRTDSVQGTDFSWDDLNSFAGIPPQYRWECIAEREIIAPLNTKYLAYPYTEGEYDFGPFGVSFANDRWEIRKAWVIRFIPKNEDHPYHHKDLYIDRETYVPLYSFAYDRRKELWKIIWHNHRYSEDWKGNDPKADDGVWYSGWEGVDEPKDLRTISDIIVNVQTGTGNRIESWDNNGMPFPKRSQTRTYIDLRRLSQGR